MYEWLYEELRRIGWPDFHVVTPCRDPLDGSLPPSYLAFVRRFGSAKLYSAGDYHQIEVCCPPERSRLPDGEALRIGRWLSSDAYLMASELAEGREAAVYEMTDGEMDEVAGDFETWLEACAEEAREEYSSDDWKRLERGPDPFTSEERSILKARRKFSWKFLGAGPGDSLRFSVRNGSERFLKAITIGVKARGGVVEARLPIDTPDLAPGEERIVDVPGFATLPAEDAVAFDLPEPSPEQRDRYSELATRGPMKR